MPTTKVFLSSTVSNAKLLEQLSKLDLPEGVSVAAGPAGPSPVRQAGLLPLERCGAVLGLIGPTFGPAQELELRRAEERKVPLALVLSEADKQEPPVKRVIARAEASGAVVRVASSPEELATLAEELLRQLGAQALAAVTPPPPAPVVEPEPAPVAEPEPAFAAPVYTPEPEPAFVAPVYTPEPAPTPAPVIVEPAPVALPAPPVSQPAAPVIAEPAPVAAPVAVPAPSPAPVARAEEALSLPPLPGRGALLADVVRALTPGAKIALRGPDGLGKTTLARAAAQALSPRFSDGIIWIDVAGRGLVAAENRLGWALGEDISIEHNRSTRQETLRRLLERKRVLLVLDDAGDKALWPLLSLVPQGAVLLTARDLPHTLDSNDLRQMTVSPLSPDEGAEVVQALLPSATPEQGRSLAKTCGGLPLGLAIAAATIQAQQIPVTQATTAIAAESAENRAEAAARYTLAQLPEESRTLFAAAGVIPSATLPTGAVAAIAEVTADAAEAILRGLAGRQLLAAVTPGRYQLPAALRNLARELSKAGAELRASSYYRELGRANQKASNVSYNALEEDREGIVLSARALMARLKELPAKKRGFFSRIFGGKPERDERGEAAEALFELEHDTSSFLNVRGYWEDWKELTSLALDAAREVGDAKREAVYLFQLGSVQRLERDFSGARANLTSAIQQLEVQGDRGNKAQALHNLALLSIEEKKNKEALSLLDQAIAHADPQTAATWQRLKAEIESSLRGKPA